MRHTVMSPRADTLPFLGAVILLFISGAYVALAADPVVYTGITVAGIPGVSGTNQGLPGASTLRNPVALCGSPYPGEKLVIGDTGNFRFTSFSDYKTTKWFGVNNGGQREGRLSDVNVGSPSDCFSVRVPGSQQTVMYFVESTKFVRLVQGNTVRSVDVGNSEHIFKAVATYQQNLYLLSLGGRIVRCDILVNTGEPTRCNTMNLGGNAIPGAASMSVTADGIFVATGRGIQWYEFSGSLRGALSDAQFVSITHARKDNTAYQYYASTTSDLYAIQVDVTTGTMKPTLLVKSPPQLTCSGSTGWANGENPSFCGISRIFARNEDEIYASSPSTLVVRVAKVMPKRAEVTLKASPLPVGMMGEGEILPQLLELMDAALNEKLGAERVRTSLSESAVNPATWDTKVAVDVPQRNYLPTTQDAILDTNFDVVLNSLQAFYDMTDEVVYGDRNLLPLCNRSKMWVVKQDVAAVARRVLMYPYVYTDSGEVVTINGNPNITKIKLLLPSSFGNIPEHFCNATTHLSLESADFSGALLMAVEKTYADDRQYRIDFPEEKYHFGDLSPEQQQEARWLVLKMVQDQLALCAKMSGDPSGGGHGDGSSGGDGELIPGCQTQVAITNLSTRFVPGSQFPQNDMRIFVPEDFNYTFSFSTCLRDTDWSDLEYWINNVTVTKAHRACGTGCIVGIAIGAAILTAIIVAILVVVTSKRRRLATVVTPGGDPKFSSTLDDLDGDGNWNPLGAERR